MGPACRLGTYVKLMPSFFSCQVGYSALNLQEATLFADNQMLASVVLARSSRTHLGHWSLRPVIAEIHDINQARNYIVIKIRREVNKISDSLAKKARPANISNSCFFLVRPLAHHPTCNIKHVLENNDWSNKIPIFVTCVVMQ